MGLGCEWRHARKRWAGNFGDFEKKQLVEIRTWARPVQLWATGCAFVESLSWDLNLGEGSPAEGYGMRGGFVGSVSWDWTLGRPVQLRSWLKDDVRTVSIVKIVSISPRVEKLKVKKINKRFVPELKKVVSVSGFPCMCICYTHSPKLLHYFTIRLFSVICRTFIRGLPLCREVVGIFYGHTAILR